jgi:hypothetical protein
MAELKLFKVTYVDTTNYGDNEPPFTVKSYAWGEKWQDVVPFEIFETLKIEEATPQEIEAYEIGFEDGVDVALATQRLKGTLP